MQLTDVATSRQLWTKLFENEPRQLPLLQADIAAALLVEVDSRRTTPEQEARLEKLRTVKPEVYDAFWKGGLLATMRDDGPSIQKAIAYFQEVIRQDPNHAPAYVGLANAYMALSRTLLTGRQPSRLTTEALIHGDAEAVLVGPVVRRLAHQLLGRHVGRRSHQSACLRQCQPKLRKD